MPLRSDDTVLHTGADANDVLEGAGEANKGLRIQVRVRQPKGIAGPVDGKFVLIDAGAGPYSELLGPFRGSTFSTAKQLFSAVRDEPSGKKCTHILNKNLLRRSVSGAET
jgi:hypothetical protein